MGLGKFGLGNCCEEQVCPDDTLGLDGLDEQFQSPDRVHPDLLGSASNPWPWEDTNNSFRVHSSPIRNNQPYGPYQWNWPVGTELDFRLETAMTVFYLDPPIHFFEINWTLRPLGSLGYTIWELQYNGSTLGFNDWLNHDNVINAANGLRYEFNYLFEWSHTDGVNEWFDITGTLNGIEGPTPITRAMKPCDNAIKLVYQVNSDPAAYYPDFLKVEYLRVTQL